MAHLNFNPLSLKDMAIRRMTALLFKESNILESISNYHSIFAASYDYICPEVWQETVEDQMWDKISKLGLPESLTKQLIDTVRPMGEHVRKWKECHEEYLKDLHGEVIYFDVSILKKLCWTASGAVDYGKTAEELIPSDVIDIVKKFKLSCLYCLEDYILLFWNELPKESKKYFCNKKGRRLQSGGLGLEFWWPYIIKGEESKLDDLTRSNRGDQITFHQFVFLYSAAKGNKTSTEYFFQKLTHEEKEFSLMTITRALVAFDGLFRVSDNLEHFPNEKVSDVLSYLLSLMTPEQQMQIFQENPTSVLASFLKWPLQDIFLEIAELTWDLFSEIDYNFLLWEMYESFKNSGDYLQNLCQEFFLRIPRDFRKNFLDRECESGSYFDDILILKNIEALKIFFRSVDAAARVKLIFSRLALEYFYKSISSGSWDVVEVCLREARLSREDRERLKEAFMVYLTSTEGGEMKLKTRKWTRFFHFLDETNAAPSKRFSENETLTEAKKTKLSYEEQE